LVKMRDDGAPAVASAVEEPAMENKRVFDVVQPH
jgi:hypothetical protein